MSQTNWEELIPQLIAVGTSEDCALHKEIHKEVRRAPVKEMIAYAVLLARNVYKNERFTAWADSYLHGNGAGEAEELYSLAARDSGSGSHAAMAAAGAVFCEANVSGKCSDPAGWASDAIWCAAYDIHEQMYRG